MKGFAALQNHVKPPGERSPWNPTLRKFSTPAMRPSTGVPAHPKMSCVKITV